MFFKFQPQVSLSIQLLFPYKETAHIAIAFPILTFFFSLQTEKLYFKTVPHFFGTLL